MPAGGSLNLQIAGLIPARGIFSWLIFDFPFVHFLMLFFGALLLVFVKCNFASVCNFLSSRTV